MSTSKKNTTKTTKNTSKTAAKVAPAKKAAAPKAEKKEKATKPVGPRGKNPGITKLLKEMATAKPVTHEEVLKALVKAFPDRRAEGMAITVRALLPSALLRKGVKVVTTKGADKVKRFQIVG